jgi:two-component system cell cycle sensor histidine kinase/response regulator CckA
LIVEDSEDDAMLLLRELGRGFDVTHLRVDTPEAMVSALNGGPWDIVLSDYSMPRFSAPDAFATLQRRGLDLPFIIVSGTVGEDTAVDAMRLGVHDYIVKGKLARLLPAIERELRECESRRRRRIAEEELRKTEEQLRHAQKMEAVGRLAGGVAHDFNNVLSVILSYCELILADPQNTGSLRTDLVEVRTAGLRAAELTKQLLLFSRQQVIEAKVFDLGKVVGGMEKLLRPLLGADVELTILTSREVGRVWADEGQIVQVVMNLAVNARDAMPRGGKLTIETRNVELDEDYARAHHGVTPGQYVMLAATDTGTGMDRATQARIFDPFFTTKEKGKGTGLGLSTVFGTIQQAGGHLWVYSEPGEGTTFKIYLPRTDAPETKKARAAPAVSKRGTETILLVEDDEQLRKVTRGILTGLGYTVLDAAAGPEALRLCEKHDGKIHLLVTDVVMPKMSGPQLAEKVVAMRPGIRALFMSGYTDDAIVNHGVLESGVDFLQKPLTPDAVARKIREVLTSPRGRGGLGVP